MLKYILQKFFNFKKYNKELKEPFYINEDDYENFIIQQIDDYLADNNIFTEDLDNKNPNVEDIAIKELLKYLSTENPDPNVVKEMLKVLDVKKLYAKDPDVKRLVIELCTKALDLKNLVKDKDAENKKDNFINTETYIEIPYQFTHYLLPSDKISSLFYKKTQKREQKGIKNYLIKSVKLNKPLTDISVNDELKLFYRPFTLDEKLVANYKEKNTLTNRLPNLTTDYLINPENISQFPIKNNNAILINNNIILNYDYPLKTHILKFYEDYYNSIQKLEKYLQTHKHLYIYIKNFFDAYEQGCFNILPRLQNINLNRNFVLTFIVGFIHWRPVYEIHTLISIRHTKLLNYKLPIWFLNTIVICLFIFTQSFFKVNQLIHIITRNNFSIYKLNYTLNSILNLRQITQYQLPKKEKAEKPKITFKQRIILLKEKYKTYKKKILSYIYSHIDKYEDTIEDISSHLHPMLKTNSTLRINHYNLIKNSKYIDKLFNEKVSFDNSNLIVTFFAFIKICYWDRKDKIILTLSKILKIDRHFIKNYSTWVLSIIVILLAYFDVMRYNIFWDEDLHPFMLYYFMSLIIILAGYIAISRTLKSDLFNEIYILFLITLLHFIWHCEGSIVGLSPYEIYETFIIVIFNNGELFEPYSSPMIIFNSNFIITILLIVLCIILLYEILRDETILENHWEEIIGKKYEKSKYFYNPTIQRFSNLLHILHVDDYMSWFEETSAPKIFSDGDNFCLYNISKFYKIGEIDEMIELYSLMTPHRKQKEKTDKLLDEYFKKLVNGEPIGQDFINGVFEEIHKLDNMTSYVTGSINWLTIYDLFELSLEEVFDEIADFAFYKNILYIKNKQIKSGNNNFIEKLRAPFNDWYFIENDYIEDMVDYDEELEQIRYITAEHIYQSFIINFNLIKLLNEKYSLEPKKCKEKIYPANMEITQDFVYDIEKADILRLVMDSEILLDKTSQDMFSLAKMYNYQLITRQFYKLSESLGYSNFFSAIAETQEFELYNKKKPYRKAKYMKKSSEIERKYLYKIKDYTLQIKRNADEFLNHTNTHENILLNYLIDKNEYMETLEFFFIEDDVLYEKLLLDFLRQLPTKVLSRYTKKIHLKTTYRDLSKIVKTNQFRNIKIFFKYHINFKNILAKFNFLGK